jgi:integrase
VAATHYQNWRRRRFNEPAKAAGLSGVTPYTLRHSFASLLLAEQLNIAEVAAQLGH